MNSLYPKRHLNHLRGELITISLIVLSAFFLFVIEDKYHSRMVHPSSSTGSIFKHLNVHDKYYSVNHDKLELRFPFRKRNDPLAYIRQVFIVFGGATLLMIILMRKMHLQLSLQDITGWDISILCCTLNLIFSYVFGFVAVINDWWFFFPDLITGNIWQIRKGQMVLGDVLFYPMAVIMGHVGVLFVKRLQDRELNAAFDNFLKILWFAIALTITLWGIRYGLTVMKVMIYFLYIPFCIIGLFLYRKYTGFELWSITLLFVLCEFLWDLVARIEGIWIFPDASTHPGLYLTEIVFGHIGSYPLVWQPEMTQMAFSSGIISLVFFHLAWILLRREQVSSAKCRVQK